MASYLFRARHTVSLPEEVTSSPQELTDWLERTLCTDGVEVVRTGDTSLEFRSKFRLMGGSKQSLAFLSNGEIEVSPAKEGSVVSVRANPQMWQGILAMGWFATVVGLGNAIPVLGWGAGLGGILIGGVVVFLTWGSINTFLIHKAEVFRMLRTRPELPPKDRGAA